MVNNNFQSLSFNSPSELETFLKDKGVALDKWQKTSNDLCNEIKNQDCSLGFEDGNLIRRVDVVRVKCFYHDEKNDTYQLVEDKQVFKNGLERVRKDFDFIAEKKQPMETPEAAARRGIAEELGIRDENIELVPENNFTKKLSSPSYAGINSVYNTYVYKIVVPKEHFKPEGYIENQEDKSSYFSWHKI